MSGETLGSSPGMAEASDAFKATLDAEQPSRSRTRKERRPDPPSTRMEELFPRREMDRSEPEGGEREGDPEIVKKARQQAREQARDVSGDTDFGEDTPRPRRRAPIEGNDAGPDDGEDEAEDLAPDDAPEDEPGPDEGDEDQSEDEEGLPLDLNQIVEVNVDGQPLEVSLNEALRGYIRQETFHQRLGELQQGVQALQGQRGELDQARQAFVARAQELEAYVQAFMPQEPNWDALYAENPALAAQQERRWRSFNEQVQNLIAHRAATQQELDAERVRNIHNFANANRAKLAQMFPEWKDEKVWRRDHDSMRRTARSAGYSDDEINQLYDARGVVVLLKASKYDRLMATKPRPVRGPGATPLKRNGATPSRNASRSFERAERRLSRTGSIQAAADVFETILDREK